MSEGFGPTADQYKQERDKAHRQLEAALRDNQVLRKVLIEVRPVLITSKHRQLIDAALKLNPPPRL